MELSGIIHSKIIREDINVFWQAPEHIADMQHKPVLVLSLPHPDGSPELLQLHKMLAACKLDISQYNVLQITENQYIAWHILKHIVRPRFILLTGIHTTQLGISALLRLNEPNHFGDCIWIPALPVTEWNKHPETKKQLWECLQTVFINKSFGNI